jgi:hypothetical protein
MYVNIYVMLAYCADPDDHAPPGARPADVHVRGAATLPAQVSPGCWLGANLHHKQIIFSECHFLVDLLLHL